jgi:O-antigen ligase
MRKIILFVAALVALAGSAVAVWATTAERDFELRGYVDPTLDANLPLRHPLLGVNAELSQYSADELRQHLDWMQQAHVRWIRQIFPWDAIETNKGNYQWEQWDEIVNAVNQNSDLQIVAVLMNSPDWARTSNNNTAPPDNPEDFAAFTHAFARRYGQQIDYYQIWDEPNLDDAWGGNEPRPADYLAVLQAAYEAIHAADESATVIAAALAPTIERGPDNIADVLYLRDLYLLGAREYMDAVAAKPYGFELPPLDRAVDLEILNFSRIVALREEMIKHGDGQKALWASNWGWNSLPDDWQGNPSIWGEIEQQNRIQYSLTALDRAEREWPWIGGMIFHHWQPDAPADDPQWGFAIIDQEGNRGDLWQALVNRPQPSAAQNGLFPAANPFARYSGVWTLSDFGADIGWLKDSQLEFMFNGQDVALLIRQDDYVGYLYPTIDGKAANATPRDSMGNAYVILTSGSLEPELKLIPVAQNLGTETHQLRAVADRGWDRWALAGYAVSSGNLAEPYNRQISMGWLAILAAAVSVIVTGRGIPWAGIFSPLAALWQRLDDTRQLAISAFASVALMIGMLLTWGDSTPNLFRREPIQLAIAIVTAGIVYLQPHLILTLMALLALFVIFYHRPDFGLMLTIFYAPFFLFPVELYRFAFPMSELLILITFSAWLLKVVVNWAKLRQSRSNQHQIINVKSVHILDFAVIAWFVLGCLSLLWTERRSPAVTELRTMIFEPALFYLVLRGTLVQKRDFIRIIDTLLIAGIVVAVIGLWLFARGEAIITAEEGARRLASVYGSPNNVGLFLGRCIPFALAYALIQTDRIRRVVACVALIVMGAALLLTQSAGAIFIGVPAAVMAVLIAVYQRRAFIPIAAFAGLGLAALPFASQSARFTRLFDFRTGTNFYRLRVWESALNIIRDHPVTGLGLDQFLYAFRGRYILPDAWQEPNLSHPHNFILDFWVRLGILGVALFIGVQIAFWRTALALYQIYHPRDQVIFALIVGIIGSMVNLLAHGLVDNSVFVQDLTYIFVLLLGLTVNLSNTGAIDAER